MGRFSYSPQARHLWSSFGECLGDSLTHPRLDISGRRSARGGEILLLAPGWTSLVVVRRVVGRFSYSPQAGHLWSSFGEWWGDSLTRPRLDISGRRSACGREILLLALGWTSLDVVRRVVGRFSYSPLAGHLWSSFGAWWGDSLPRPRLDMSCRPLAHGGEILFLAPGWTALVVVRRVVGRFSYSPQAGHLWSSFGAWWGDSLTRPRLDSSGRRVVGRFSYSPQVGHLLSSFGAWWGDSLTRPRLDISGRCSARVGAILLLAAGWTSLVVVRRMLGRFSVSYTHLRAHET